MGNEDYEYTVRIEPNTETFYPGAKHWYVRVTAKQGNTVRYLDQYGAPSLSPHGLWVYTKWEARKEAKRRIKRHKHHLKHKNKPTETYTVK